MTDIDWTQLWLLNRTIYMPCRTSLLIHDVTKEHFGFWQFPERPAIQATPEARIEALHLCVVKGFIQLYANSWMEDCQFQPNGALPIGQCDFHDSQFLEQSQASVTLEGHNLWEAEFQPDWRRYWREEGVLDRSAEDSVLQVTYTSDEMLQELVHWLPGYLRLDKELGLQKVACNTVFQYQATKWKSIPCVKVITWRVKPDDTLNRIAQSASLATDEPQQQQLRKQIENHFRVLREEQQEAIKILTRLSKKWDCVTPAAGTQHDTIPVLRSAN